MLQVPDCCQRQKGSQRAEFFAASVRCISAALCNSTNGLCSPYPHDTDMKNKRNKSDTGKKGMEWYMPSSWSIQQAILRFGSIWSLWCTSGASRQPVLGSIIVEGISQVTSTAIRRKHRGGCIIFGEVNLNKRSHAAQTIALVELRWAKPGWRQKITNLASSSSKPKSAAWSIRSAGCCFSGWSGSQGLPQGSYLWSWLLAIVIITQHYET